MRIGACIALLSITACAGVERDPDEESWNISGESSLHNAIIFEVSVHQDNKVHFNGEEVTLADLKRKYAIIREVSPSPVILVTYDGAAPPSMWTEVVDLSEREYCREQSTWCWKGTTEEATKLTMTMD